MLKLFLATCLCKFALQVSVMIGFVGKLFPYIAHSQYYHHCDVSHVSGKINLCCKLFAGNRIPTEY